MLANASRLRALLSLSSLDAIVAATPENVAYLANYYCLSHWCNKGTPVFVIAAAEAGASTLVTIPLEYSAWAEAQSPVDRVRLHGTTYSEIGIRKGDGPFAPVDQQLIETCMERDADESWLDAVVAALREQGLDRCRLGIDERGFTRPMWDALAEVLPKAELVAASDVLRRTRMVKTSEEIELLREAAAISERALAETLAAIRPGVTEYELVCSYNSMVAAEGASPSLTLISAGRRSAHPHALPSREAMKDGDVVKCDLGCTYQLYWADTARARVVGGASEKLVAVHDAVVTGVDAAIETVRPGARPSEVYATAIGAVREAGIPDYQRHHVGHGIGIEIYDYPLLQAAGAESELSGLGSLDAPLEPGMVVNIECPYYEIGEWGLNVEDTVLVTEHGHDRLTHLDRALSV